MDLSIVSVCKPNKEQPGTGLLFVAGIVSILSFGLLNAAATSTIN